MYEISEGNPFYFTLKVLIWGILYPTKFDRRSITRFFIFGLLLRCMMGLIFVFPLLHFIMLRKENIDLDFSENFAIAFTGGCGFIVQTGFALLSENISKFLCDITEFTIFGKPVRFEESFKTINRVSRIVFYYFSIGFAVYSLNNYVRIENCIKNQELTEVHLICRVVIPTWWPHPLSKSTEWLIFTYQHIAVIFFLLPGAMVYCLIWQMIHMTAMHFEVLKLTFPKIIAKQDERKRCCMLKLWLMYHVRILKLSRQLNSLVKKSVGSSYLFAAFLLGCIINMMGDPYLLIGSLLFLIGFSIPSFFLLDAGQKLQDAIMKGACSYFSLIHNTK